MYRVVLIDDEAVILEGLKRVVKWENYDCQVVGTAFDSQVRQRPDPAGKAGYPLYGHPMPGRAA